MKYKGILLDLDDTLYNYQHAHEKAQENMLNKCVEITSFEKELLGKVFNSARNATHRDLQHTASSHNRVLYYVKMLEILKVDTTFALDLYDAYWDCFLENMVLYKGVISTLQNLKDRNIKICIVTDLTTHIQLRKIKKMNLNRYVDYVVTSEEVGVEKPSKHMYLTALNKLKLQSEDVVMVGDNYKKDILGGENIGIESILFNNTSQDVKCKKIYQFSQLLEVMK